jgi:cytochrome c oxidase cbb3-type subunit IV
MLSGIITAVLLSLFLIGTIWAYSPRRKRDFDAAAALPFDEGDGEAVAEAVAVANANASDNIKQETPR